MDSGAEPGTSGFMRFANEHRSSLIVALVLALWFGVVANGVDNSSQTTLDMGEFLNNPVRMLSGELPYRDFWLIMPPGEVVAPAFLYELGFDINGVQHAMALVSVLVGLAAFGIGRALLGSTPLAALVACLVFFNGLTYHHQGFRYIHAYLLALLVAFGFLLHFWSSNRRASLFACGLFLGVAIAFRLYFSGAVALACLIAVALEGRRRGEESGTIAEQLGALVFGAALVPLGFSIALRDAFAPMFQSVVIDSVLHATVRSIGYFERVGVAASSFAGALSGGDVPRAVDSLEEILNRLLPLVAIALWVFWLRARQEDSSERKRLPGTESAIWVLVLWSAFAFIRAFTRGTMPKVAHATTPLFFVLVFLWNEFRILGKQTGSRAHQVTASCLGVMIIGFSLHWVSVSAHEFGSVLRPGNAVRAPYGTLYMRDAKAASEAQQLVDIVTEQTSESDYIFVTPKRVPPLYALTRRKNPTPHDSMIDLVYRPSDEAQREVCRNLIDHPTALIIHSTKWGFGPERALRFENACPILNECIERGFSRIAKVGAVEVLAPRGR